MDVFRIFFFCSGRGKGKSEASGGGGLFLKIPGGGGVLQEGPRGREGVCGEFGNLGGGGGLNIFFRGRNVHQDKRNLQGSF